MHFSYPDQLKETLRGCVSAKKQTGIHRKKHSQEHQFINVLTPVQSEKKRFVLVFILYSITIGGAKVVAIEVARHHVYGAMDAGLQICC